MSEAAGRSSPPIEVLIVSPPDQQAALAAALPPEAFHLAFAPPAEGTSSLPAVILFSLESPADLPHLVRWAQSGPPVIALLDAAAGLAEQALAGGARDYLYRVGHWPGLVPFHLRRAVGAASSSADEEVRQRLNQLAHDLRGSLTYLVGYSELLALRDVPPDQVRQMAQEMLREAEKLAQRLDRFHPPRSG